MRKKNTAKKSSKFIHKLLSSIIIFVFGFAVMYMLTTIIYSKYISLRTPCGNSISCKTEPKLEIAQNAVGIFNNKSVKAPNIALNDIQQANSVLGEQTSSEKKHIYVNLTEQKLYAYEGDKLFMETPISSGLWGRTPTGTFTIWSKFVASRMTGGSGADFYDLPNVPYVMFFSNAEVAGSRGFSLHGTYWHNNFGHEMSHGCVNMRTIDAKLIYEWSEKSSNESQGTLITIYEDN